MCDHFVCVTAHKVDVQLFHKQLKKVCFHDFRRENNLCFYNAAED